MREIIDADDRGFDLAVRAGGLSGELTDPRKIAFRLHSRAGNLLGQGFHLFGDHGKAPAGISGPRCLDPGVERQEAALRSKRPDPAKHIARAADMGDQLLGNMLTALGTVDRHAHLRRHAVQIVQQLFEDESDLTVGLCRIRHCKRRLFRGGGKLGHTRGRLARRLQTIGMSAACLFRRTGNRGDGGLDFAVEEIRLGRTLLRQRSQAMLHRDIVIGQDSPFALFRKEADFQDSPIIIMMEDFLFFARRFPGLMVLENILYPLGRPSHIPADTGQKLVQTVTGHDGSRLAVEHGQRLWADQEHHLFLIEHNHAVADMGKGPVPDARLAQCSASKKRIVPANGPRVTVADQG